MTRAAGIESALEMAAAGWFGSCVLFSLWLITPGAELWLLSLVLGGFLLALVGGFRFRQQTRRPRYPLRTFSVAGIQQAEPDELLLAERLGPVTHPVEELVLTLKQRFDVQRELESSPDELLLEDVLAEISCTSRVVRLFDPAAMPTAGELQSRIDRHLQDRDTSAFPDAAQALNDALTDLRRSLR